MDKLQETLIAFIIGGILLVFGVAWFIASDSWGATLLTLIFMIIPGTIISIYGIHLLRGNKAPTAIPKSNLKRYDWMLISIGLGLSLFVVAGAIWIINQF